ncbi:Dynactin subunit 3 [Chamberlinius hualienensis]
MDNQELKVILDRLENLENKIYKKDHTDINSDIKVEDVFQNVSNKINIALIGREKVKSIFKRIDEIERLLEPSLGEELTLTDSSKLSIIKCQENLVKERLEQLQKINDLESVLNSEHVKAVPSLQGKLKSMKHIQFQQEEQVSNLSDDVQKLISSYNSLISLLTQQFILWEDIVTKAELAKAAATKTKS